MWTTVLIQLGWVIFKALPIERIVAKLMNRILDKIGTSEEYTKALKTMGHLEEISEKMRIIMEDATVSEDEVQILNDVYTQDIAEIINLWSKGESAKELEAKVAAATK